MSAVKIPSVNDRAAARAAARHEEIWSELPLEVPTYAWERRRDFLLGAVVLGVDVLDFGCGAGDFTAALARAGARPVGVDVSATALERARARHPGLDFRPSDPAAPLPFDDASFDLAWVSEVLAFLVDTAGTLSELGRVLRPGARLLVTTPRHGRLGVMLRGLGEPFDPTGPYLRFYTPRSLRRVLGELGFEDVRVRAAGGAPGLRESLHASARR